MPQKNSSDENLNRELSCDRPRDRELTEAARLQAIDPCQPFGKPESLATKAESGVGFRTAVGGVSLDLSRGQHLGDYELLECVGRGGMGAVFRAKHAHLRRVVALKVLPQLQFADATTKKRFRREIEMIGGLPQSDHVIQASDAREIDGLHFLVMEFVEGPHLGQLVKCFGQIPIADACEMVRQVAKGLAHLDAHGLVHRDIKPANLIASREGVIKILDLGLACLQTDSLGDHDLTLAGQAVGTPDYIAPEQWDDSRSTDIRTDIYSLGCTFYFLLSGRAPFHASKSHQSKRLAHLKEEPQSIADLRSNVSPKLVDVVAKMLAKAPGSRFQTPAAVAEALLPLAQGAKVAELVRIAELKLSEESGNQTTCDTNQFDEQEPGTTLVFSGANQASLAGPAQTVIKDRKWLLVALTIVAALFSVGFVLWRFSTKPGERSTEVTSREDLAYPSISSDVSINANPPSVRERALQILRLGITVNAQTEFGRVDMTHASEIPEGPFDIVGIDVGEAKLSEDDLIPLLPEDGLRFLHIPGCRLTTNGLNEIVARAPGIEALHLGAIDLSDVDLFNLRELKQLNTLWIGRTGIGDEAAVALAQLESLEYLWMGETAITNQGIRLLHKLTNMQGLGLEYTQVTSECLPDLAKMQLYTLVLIGLPFTDDDIQLLAEMKSLQELNLTDTKITAEGRARLRQFLPECQVH